jgi:hypothetical protein
MSKKVAVVEEFWESRVFKKEKFRGLESRTLDCKSLKVLKELLIRFSLLQYEQCWEIWKHRKKIILQHFRYLGLWNLECLRSNFPNLQGIYSYNFTVFLGGKEAIHETSKLRKSSALNQPPQKSRLEWENSPSGHILLHQESILVKMVRTNSLFFLMGKSGWLFGTFSATSIE